MLHYDFRYIQQSNRRWLNDFIGNGRYGFSLDFLIPAFDTSHLLSTLRSSVSRTLTRTSFLPTVFPSARFLAIVQLPKTSIANHSQFRYSVSLTFFLSHVTRRLFLPVLLLFRSRSFTVIFFSHFSPASQNKQFLPFETCRILLCLFAPAET